MLSAEELFRTWVHKKALWEAMPLLKIKVETVDVRRAFGRVDVLIRPLQDHGTGQSWVDSRYLEILD
jgi:hypothetical protein